MHITISRLRLGGRLVVQRGTIVVEDLVELEDRQECRVAFP